MKKLPISRQDFRELINEDCLYIDKTKYIYQLISEGFEYFMSRPRRFGKSLLITTLREIFSGSKELFKGLWIYDKIQWKKHPIIQISFNQTGYKEIGLERAINKSLNGIAIENSIVLDEKESYSLLFLELIKKLAATGEKVVILIDEYDKPIIDYLDNIPKAEENREILKNFYSVIKDNEQHIKFLFITGVSKFSKVSIFSDLNHLTDITLNKKYNNLLGITREELKVNFNDYIQKLADDYKDIYPDIYKAIENEYLGYSWDGKNYVYNPYGIMNVLNQRTMIDYWYQSGTPTFLMKLIKGKKFTIFDIRNQLVEVGVLDKYEISDIDILPLLFQTGYLTIKSWNLQFNTLLIDFPNREVERAFSIHLLSELNGRQAGKTSALLTKLTSAISGNNINEFMRLMKILIKGITYYNIESKEIYFHSIFYLVIRLLGFYIESEILTSDGRLDCLIGTGSHIYIIEFKLSDAKAAMQQIKEKQYHLKYMDDERSIVLLGIAFNIENKTINEFSSETVK